MRRIGIALLLLTFLPAIAMADAGYALQFDGIDDFIDCGADAFFEPQNQITAEAWFIVDEFESHEYFGIIGKSIVGSYAGENPYVLGYFRLSHEILFCVRTGATNWAHIFFDISSFLGSWNHIAGTYDGQYARLYLNGRLVASQPIIGPLYYGNGGRLYIGAEGAGVDNNWHGKLDKIRLWDVARTQAEIQQAMYGPLRGDEFHLIADWEFDEGQGDIVHDLSHNGLDARLGSTEGPDDGDPVWVASWVPDFPRAIPRSESQDWFCSSVMVNCSGPLDNNGHRWTSNDFNETGWLPWTYNEWFLDDYSDRFRRRWLYRLPGDEPVLAPMYYNDGADIFVNGDSIGHWGALCHGGGAGEATVSLRPYLSNGTNLIALHETNGPTTGIVSFWLLREATLSPFHLISPYSGIVITNLDLMAWQGSYRTDSSFEATYKVYWDEDWLFDSPDSSGVLSDTLYEMPSFLSRSHPYYWRVLAIGGNGDYRFSNEQWAFYLDGYPMQPAIFSPNSGIDADSSTYLSWLLSSDPDSFDAVSYTVQIDDDSAFASPEVNQAGLRSGTVMDDAYAIRLGILEGFGSLQVDTRYFWRVRADDGYGLSCDWTDGSNWFVFMAQNHPPAAPDSGFSPSGGEEIISLTPLITWNSASDPDTDDHPGTLSYALRLSADSGFIGFVLYDTTAMGINQVQPASELVDNTRYFYQVKTLDNGGLSSGWSAIQHFWTNHYNFPPEPFPLLSPGEGQRRVDYYTRFSWGNTVDYDPNSSFSFTLEYSPDSLFRFGISAFSSLTDTALAIPTDSLTTSLGPAYWRVWAVDDDSLTRLGGLPEGARTIVILPAGDANANGVTNGIDVSYLVNYLKGLGPVPDPLLAGDANGSCQTNGIDVTYLVNYLKGIGSAPIRGDCQ